MGHDRWLVFSWYQLSKRYNIVLYYSPPGKDVQVGANQLHVAWKVITAGPGDGSVCLPCSNRYGVGRVKALADKVFCANWTELERGKAVELRPPVDTGNGRKSHTWEKSTVRNIDRPSMQVRNGTEESEDLVLGIIRTLGSYPISIFESSFVWKAVRPKHGITMNFDPTLCAIVSEEYRESEIIMTPVKPEQVIWRQNVGKLEEATYLELLEDDDEGLIIRKTE